MDKIIPVIENTFEKVNIYIFGSLLEDKVVASSDIDVIIECEVAKNHMKRAEIMAKIEEKSNLPLYHPFQFHLLTNEELNIWKKIFKIKPKKIN